MASGTELLAISAFITSITGLIGTLTAGAIRVAILIIERNDRRRDDLDEGDGDGDDGQVDEELGDFIRKRNERRRRPRNRRHRADFAVLPAEPG